MADPFDKFNSVDPTATATKETTETVPTETGQETATTENTTAVQTTETTQASTPQVDPFFETFNKRYGTPYKSDDEIKPLFTLPKKVTELEAKVKDRDELARSHDQIKRDLENLRQAEAAKYLSTPIMQKAFVAQQLQAKYPDKDPFILQEIAMSDLGKMDNIEAIAKEKKINFPDLSLEDIKAVVMSDLNIDPASDPKEWDSLTQAKVRMRGAEAKANIKRLAEGIELPKIESPEEYKKRAEAELLKKTEQVAPIKAQFSQFSEIKLREDLPWSVPEEFKSKLGDMFDTFVVKAGVEPTPENVEILNNLREAFVISQYKEDILSAMYKDVESKLKKKEDEENGNTVPPNTSTASDAVPGKVNPLPGHSDFQRDIQGQRVTHLR